MEDPLLPKNYRGEQRSGCRRILIIVGFLFLSLAFLYMLVISILSPILWVNYNNSIAQNSLDASIISFDSMTLKNPTQNTLTVDSNITISQAGKFAATLKSSTVNVLYQGEVFGRMELPERELKGDNEPTSFTQSSLLTITNPTVFQQASAKLLKGSNVRWRLSGDVTLSVKMGFSLDFSLRLEKDVELFGAKLEDVRAYNLKVVQGLEDRLIVSQTQYVNNPSNIAMENMGDLTFDIYVPQLDASHTRSLKRFRAPTSTLDGFVKISEVYINNFNSPRGPNTIKNTTAAAIRTANNVASLENFLSTWNMGKDQSVRLVGPIASSTNSSFLLNILDIEATIEGNPTNKIIQYARFGDDDSGNPVQTAYNPLDLPVTQSDFDFEVYLTAPFFPYFDGMGAAFAIASFNNLACVAKPTFGNLSLAGVDATIPAKSYENISVTVSSNSKQFCDSFRIWAVCCGLYSGTFDSQDGATNPYLNITNRSFQIGTRGTMTTKIEKFKFTQTFQQDGFNMTCGTDTDYFNNLCYTGQGPSTYCLQSNNQYCNSLLPPPPTPAPPTPAPPTPAPPAPAPK